MPAGAGRKTYDEAYFRKWYRDPRTRVHTPDSVRRKVRMVVGVTEYFLGRKLRSVLDIGGRIQPYRPLLEGRLRSYFAADPQLEGLVDVVCLGETLPFRDSSFNLVVCTQVLTYVSDPARVVEEIYRVLRKGGHLILSVPSFFPEHHDERWRILPGGLRLLLARFETLRIEPEGHSIAGLFRAINVSLHYGMRSTWRRLAEHTTVPALNLAGRLLDRLAAGNDMCTANYSVLARK